MYGCWQVLGGNYVVRLSNKIDAVINASGRMTKLGVSTQSDGVKEAMQYGASHYYLIDDLYESAGEEIAKMLDVEAVVVTSSASAGISLAVAGLICKDDDYLKVRLPRLKETIAKREVVIMKGQNVDFGVPIETMIELGGGKVVEAGWANGTSEADMAGCINENTLALMYVKSSHCVQKNMLSFEKMVEIAKKHNIPLIADVAAEVDFQIFYEQGADIVIYSGAKTLLGPTSGFVECKSKVTATYIRKQLYGIGRGMKIGKENIFGLVEAIYEYKNDITKMNVTYADLEEFIKHVNEIKGLSAVKCKDESGREIYRAKITFDKNEYGYSALEMEKRLAKEEPAIYTRSYEANLGHLHFDPRPLNSIQELNTILETLQNGGKND